MWFLIFMQLVAPVWVSLEPAGCPQGLSQGPQIHLVVEGGLSTWGRYDLPDTLRYHPLSLLPVSEPRLFVTVPAVPTIPWAITDPSIPCVGWARSPAVIIK